ncbi:MAG: DNA-binding protein HU [Clostridiales bacterium 38_11]|nr:MAG: DNA-binding protein HU [Clostridiales bacterium 38_11]
MEFAILKYFKEGFIVNKAELVASIAEQTGFTKKDAEVALNAFMETVKAELVKGKKVQLVGFGTFEVRSRKERKGRNPRDPKQTIEIPASTAPVFKAGKSLKEAVNK